MGAYHLVTLCLSPRQLHAGGGHLSGLNHGVVAAQMCHHWGGKQVTTQTRIHLSDRRMVKPLLNGGVENQFQGL